MYSDSRRRKRDAIGIFTTAKEAIGDGGGLCLVLLLDMRRHGGDRAEDHAPVIRETRCEDGIGDEVQGKDQVAERTYDHAFRPSRRFGIVEAVEQGHRQDDQLAPAPVRELAQDAPKAR